MQSSRPTLGFRRGHAKLRNSQRLAAQNHLTKRLRAPNRVAGTLVEPCGDFFVTLLAHAFCHPADQRRVFFQRAKPGPYRNFNLIALLRKQRLRRVGVPNATAKPDDVLVIYLPKNTLTLRARET